MNVVIVIISTIHPLKKKELTQKIDFWLSCIDFPATGKT
jgi:hypothetical protein